MNKEELKPGSEWCFCLLIEVDDNCLLADSWFGTDKGRAKGERELINDEEG